MMEQESARMLKKLLREVLTNDLVLSGKQGVLLQHGNAIVGVSGYRSREEQVEIFENSLLENGRDLTFYSCIVAFGFHISNSDLFPSPMKDTRMFLQIKLL